MNDLGEVAGVDIAPGIALARGRIGDEAGEAAVLVRLDDVANAQRVDVGLEAHGEGARGLFVDHLGQAVAVHGVDVIVLLQREVLEVLLALGEADAVGGLAGGHDDLADAEFHGGFDDVVGPHDIDPVGLVVGVDQHARDGGEVNHRVDRPGRGTFLEAGEPEVGGQGVHDLAGLGDVADERGDGGVLEGLPVEVEDLVALVEQPGQHVAPRLAGAACEENTLGHGLLPDPIF